MTIRRVRVKCITTSPDIRGGMLVTCQDEDLDELVRFTADRAHHDAFASLMRSRDLFAIRDLTPQPAS